MSLPDLPVDDTDAPASGSGFELRVLRGPQAGCRLTVTPGVDYRLGSADECSILLAGQLIQPEHALLRLEHHTVEVTALDGKVTVQGLELDEDTADLDLGQIMLMGHVALCIDHSDAPWPDEADIAAGLEPVDEEDDDDLDLDLEDDEADEHEDEASGTAVDPAGPSGRTEQQTARLSVNTGAALAPQAMRPRHPRVHTRQMTALLGISGLVMLSGLAVALGPALIHGARTAQTIKPVTAPLSMSGASADSELPAPAAIPTGNETFTKETVTLALDPLIRTLEERLPASIRWSWRGEQVHVQVASAHASAIEEIKGALHDARELIGPFQIGVLHPADIETRFVQELELAGLSRKFKVMPGAPDRLSYQAVLSQEEVAAWEQLFMSFTAAYGRFPDITVKVSAEQDRLGGTIGAVIGGAFPYIVTPNGARIAPGGQLMGRTIASVQIGEIAFTDGTRYRFSP